MKENNQKGITLIALVITIIVILILASISIAMLTSNNGMIEKSVEAKQENSVGEDVERIRASFSTITMQKLKKADGRKYTITAEELQKQILADLYEKEGVTVSGSYTEDSDDDGVNEGYLTVAMPSGNKYQVDAKGTTTLMEEDAEASGSPSASPGEASD